MIDFTSGGIFAAILGPNPKAVRQAMAEVDVIACYGAHYEHKMATRYKDMLKELTGFESVALFTTGAEATEAFWRCCRVYSGKPGIWGGLVDPDEVGSEKPLSDAMHGVTLGAMIMAGRLSWPELGVWPELGESRFGQRPESTGCMIMEPYHAPSAQFHRIDPTIKRIINNQKEFPDISLCCDEIQGGFGRTGKLFAHQWYDGLKPDFVTIGKGCGAGMPLSALLGPREIMESESVLQAGHLHSTHSGHPVMAAAGCAVIEQLEKKDLIARSFRLGFQLENLLTDYCGSVRIHAGKGLMAGLEFKDADEAHRVAQLCEQKGLLVVDTHRKWIKLGPALTISVEDLENGVMILHDAINEVLNDRQPETRGDSGQGPDESAEDLREPGISST